MEMPERLDGLQRRSLFEMTISDRDGRRKSRIPSSEYKALVFNQIEYYRRLVSCLNVCLLILSWLSVEHVDCKLVQNRTRSRTFGDQLGVDLIYGQRGYDLIQFEEKGRANRRADQDTETSKGEPIGNLEQRPSRQPLLQGGSIAKPRQNHTLDTTKSEARIDLLETKPRIAKERENGFKEASMSVVPQESKSMPRLQSVPVVRSQDGPERHKTTRESNSVEDDNRYGEEEVRSNGKPSSSNRRNQLDGRASVRSKASVDDSQLYEPPPQATRMVTRNRPNNRQLPLTIDNGGEQAGDQSETPSDGPDKQEEESGPTPEAEAAERRELEAAEASEADEANRSALAEQQQQQREIIIAQAESEAKAIREQQNALLKQQQLQQQMLLRRHHSLIEDDARMSQRKTKSNKGRQQPDRKQESRSAATRERGVNQSAGQRRFNHQRASPRSDPPLDGRHQQPRDDAAQVSRETRPERVDGYVDQPIANFHGADNQFGYQQDDDDQPVERGPSTTGKRFQKHSRTISNHQVIPEAVRSHDRTNDRSSGQFQDQEPEIAEASSIHRVSMGERLNSTDSSDLLAAAQHHNYGAHYGSLDAHHGNFGNYHSGLGDHKDGGYHQYVESHKKGQFDSGFKRGNKKFVISGHSSQHKDHAKGHVKWHGKKGKGSHKWDYQHSNKKHYGSGFHYGGGHYHY